MGTVNMWRVSQFVRPVGIAFLLALLLRLPAQTTVDERSRTCLAILIVPAVDVAHADLVPLRGLANLNHLHAAMRGRIAFLVIDAPTKWAVVDDRLPLR